MGPPCLLQRQCGAQVPHARRPPPALLQIAPPQRHRHHQQQQQTARRRAAGRSPVAVAAAKAAPSSSSAPLTPEQQRLNTWMRNFSMEFELRPLPSQSAGAAPTTTIKGRVAPLPLALLPAAADLLADTFILSTMAASQEDGLASRPSLRPYTRFVRRRIAKYLDDHLRPDARTLVLAATVPLEEAAVEAEPAAAPTTPPASTSSDADLERQKMEDQALDAIFAVRLPGSDGGGSNAESAATTTTPAPPATLVGTAELSLDSSTRSRYFTLNPPDDACYLMNTAVAEPWRRRGVASALVRAADAVAAGLGAEALFLHARLIDPPAVALYESLGFEVVATDGWWVSLIGQDRRHLMKRAVRGGGGVGAAAAEGGE